MWKFLSGVSKPESKRKVDTRESNKAYDATKRKRTFQPHWLQMYKWLHFDGESQLMSCDWCKKFVKGTNNFKKDTLDYHNGNKGNAKRGVSPRLKIRPCDLENQ
jgi:hypothetical protein